MSIIKLGNGYSNQEDSQICGIFGVVASKGTLSLDQQKFLRASTITGQLRGVDGTGWFSVTPSGVTQTYKRALCGNDFLNSSQGLAAQREVLRACAVVGHNRHTTIGENIDSACHPYDYDNVVGVHNGTVPSYGLRSMGTAKSQVDVDSAQIYAYLNDTDKPIEDVLSKITMGAYALTWLDKKAHAIRIARNKERPMWAANGVGGFYFASEPGMLFWLMSRFGLSNKDSTLYELDSHTLYNIPLDDPDKVSRQVYKEIPKTYSSYNQTPPAHIGTHGAPKGAWGSSTTLQEQPHQWATPLPQVSRKFPALIPLAGSIKATSDYIREHEGADGSIEALPTDVVLDVAVTKVTSAGAGRDRISVHGYVLDPAGTGLLIPAEFLGEKAGPWELQELHEGSQDCNTLLTVRGIVRNYRVSAEGCITVYMSLGCVWAGENDIPITKEVKDIIKLTDSIRTYSGKNVAKASLVKLWEALETDPSDTKGSRC